ncbi:MAG: TRZ/ATZ family hydrolase [Oleiphilaceae bacterium]|nr:TRZ/ATZ family hydrolase [Oleiphilaceae bacterium]
MILHNTAQVNTRIDAGTILTIDDNFTTLTDHSLIIENGVITQISPTESVQHIIASEHYCLPNHVIIPGLINAHGHASMALLRGIANDLPLNIWLQEHIWPAEGKWVDSDFVSFGAKLAMAEMLKSGTTTFSDMYFFPEVVAQMAQTVGMRTQLACPILDFPTAWGSGPDEYIEKTLELHRAFESSDLVHMAFGPHAPYTVSDDPIRSLISAAREHSLPIQMHVHETQKEVNDAVTNSGKRPIKRLSELGLFDPDLNTQAVHMTALTESEISLLAKTNTSVIHCPESNMKLASGFCPTQALSAAGVNIALGTDGAASNNDLDMLGEMRTAALIAKGYIGDATALSAKECIRMATINGAKALGLEQLIGSLEVCKQADIVAIDLDHLNTLPSYDLPADIVYNTNASQVTHTWVNGKLLVDCGHLTGIDEDMLKDEARQWGQKIKSGNK